VDDVTHRQQFKKRMEQDHVIYRGREWDTCAQRHFSDISRNAMETLKFPGIQNFEVFKPARIVTGYLFDDAEE